jgi:hypothetical protein
MSSQLTIKWSTTEVAVDLSEGETVGSLKRKIEEKTRVQPKRQKLIGLKAKGGKLAGDHALISDLILKPGQKVMMMGYVGRHKCALYILLSSRIFVRKSVSESKDMIRAVGKCLQDTRGSYSRIGCPS